MDTRTTVKEGRGTRKIRKISEFLKEEQKRTRSIAELEIKEKYGKNDYTKVKDEHSLNDGEWIWYNFIEKGKVCNNFKEY